MELPTIAVLFLLAVTETLALHIVISPEEADKLMKRDDEFSKGLAGFIDKKLSKPKHVLVTKREKINELKSMINTLVNKIDSAKDEEETSKQEKASENPPWLPFDTPEKDAKEKSDLETLVENLLHEIRSKRKREQGGWVHVGKKDVDSEKEAKTKAEASDAKLEKLFSQVRALVKNENEKDSRAENTVETEETIISDSGIAEKQVKESASKDSANEVISKLEGLTKRLLKNAKPDDIGDMSLNAIKKMIAARKGSSDVKGPEVKSHPQQEANDVSLDSLLDEVKDLLRKYKPKSGKSGEHQSDEVAKEEVAVEAVENKKPVAHKADTRRALLAKLIRSYDSLVKQSKKDDVEVELEKLSSNADGENNSNESNKVSKQTGKLIKGFDLEIHHKKKRNSHPK